MESQLIKYYAGETTNHFEESYIGKLWYIVLGNDKRSFNEYFSEEFGFTLNDDITEERLNYLVIYLMIPIMEHQKEKLDDIKKLNKEMGRLTYYPFH